MNFILGSGVVGLIAKELFPDYVLVPFKKSRYYHFEIPLADNVIKYDKRINDFMSGVCPVSTPIIEKQAFSFKGQLIFEDIKDLKELYFKKIYDYDLPSYIDPLIQITYSRYPFTVQQLHNKLQDKFLDQINQNVAQYGQLNKIDTQSHTLSFSKESVQYDNIISTIPLDALLKLIGMSMDLKSHDVCFYDIIAPKVDLEGAESCMVVDEELLFFKVIKIGKSEYVFWTFDKLDQSYEYFGKFLTYNLDMVEAHRIEKAIPMGLPPDLSVFNNFNIICVGSNAQWDDWMDVTSCIIRLLKIK